MSGNLTEWSWGVRVRLKKQTGIRFGGGTIVSPPIGSARMPDGVDGCYVLWDRLREPAPAFVSDIEEIPEGDPERAEKRRR